MKILFINISDIKGGAAKSMWRIAKELERLSHQTKFIVRSKYSNSPDVIEIGRNRFINILFNLLGLQYKFLPNSRKIVKYARIWKPDVISVNQIEGGYFQTRDLIKLSKIAPIFWTMHDEWAFNNNASSRALNKVERKIYPAIGIRWGDWLLHQKKKIYDKSNYKVICPSYSLFRKKLKSIEDKSGYVIHHGINTDKFKPERIFNLLFIAEKKSKAYKLDEILNYLDNITKHRMILTAVGEGEIKGKYKNILIINRGFCDEDELLFYYQNSDLLIYPSQADNFPLVVLESIACGLPVVAFDVGGIPEIIDRCEAGVLCDTSEKFASFVEVMLDSPTLLKSFGEAGRKRAIEHFNIQHIAKQYEEIYETETKNN